MTISNKQKCGCVARSKTRQAGKPALRLQDAREHRQYQDGIAKRDLAVAEIQGLYGPFTFTERLLQKIWLRGEFDAAHRDKPKRDSGCASCIPGGGICSAARTFRQARLYSRARDHGRRGASSACQRLGGTCARGGSRVRPGRAARRAVPPSASGQSRRADGSSIPTLVLLPLLLHDLEEYAAEDAVESMASRMDWRAAEECRAWLRPMHVRCCG